MWRGLPLGIAAALLPVVAAPPDDVRPEPGKPFVEESRVRLRTARIRLVTPRLERDRHCETLGLDDLEVRIGKRPLERADLVELNRTRHAAVHALVLDTSRSVYEIFAGIRSATEQYLRSIDWRRDSAMLAYFSDELILSELRLDTLDASLAALDTVRPEAATALNDALVFTMTELDDRLHRPVIVLLSDGADSGSLHSRDDVFRYSAARPDLAVFVVGVGLPPITARRGNLSTTQKFLERLAERSGGEYFSLPTVHRLPRAFDAVRSALEREAELTVRDPRPEDELRPLRIRSRIPGCRVDTLYEVREARDASEATADADADRPRPPPLPRLDRLRTRIPGHSVDAACEPWPPLEVDRARRRVAGCALGVTMQYGMLFDANEVSGRGPNTWMKLRRRPFAFRVPELAALPTRVGEAIDLTLDGIPAEPPTPDPRKTPVDRHARPVADVTSWTDGWSWFGERASLAGALAELPDLDAWLGRRLADEAARERARLAGTLGERFPDMPADRRALALELSPAGRRLAGMVGDPEPLDVRRHLGAWLGDVSAHDALADWERVRFAENGPDDPDLERDFRRLRELLRVPSYVRVLVPRVPGRDAERERIGWWRVVLPRTAWIGPRKKGRTAAHAYRRIPYDFVYDEPWGFRLAAAIDARREAILPGAAADCEWTGLDYRSHDRPSRLDPIDGFDRLTVDVGMRCGGGEHRVRVALEADAGVRRLVEVEIDGTFVGDDAVFAALAGELGVEVSRRPRRRALRRERRVRPRAGAGSRRSRRVASRVRPTRARPRRPRPDVPRG